MQSIQPMPTTGTYSMRADTNLIIMALFWALMTWGNRLLRLVDDYVTGKFFYYGSLDCKTAIPVIFTTILGRAALATSTKLPDPK